MRIEEEMQSWAPLTTGWGSQQEQSESSKVLRIMGLDTWIAEEEPGAEEEEQPGAKEEALERKWQFPEGD